MNASRWPAVAGVLLAGLVGCRGELPGARAARAVATTAADSPMTTPSGARYTAPAGWTVTTRGGVVVLEDPDRVVSVAIVERKEPGGEAAVAGAWQQVRPGFSGTIERVAAPPGRDGWDAVTTVDYAKTSGGRIRWAHARRKRDTWYVLLLDGSDDGWVARWPGARIVIESFKAQGVEQESFRGRRAHLLDERRLGELEGFIRDAQRAAEVPGLAVAVVQGGTVVFEKGFGVRELGRPDPVTPDTLFRIGSTTKALTSLMMARLVDRGLFRWDSRAIELLPSFALADAELTGRLTMGNLVCACSGIPYDNLGIELAYADMTAEIALARMKTLAPVVGFGETYQYSNAMLAAGGFLAAHALRPSDPIGPAYHRAMQSELFDPLEMTSTTFDAAAARRAEHASPHDRTTDYRLTSTAVPTSAWTAALDPAWGAWSTVHDLSQIVLLELATGVAPDGTRVISSGNLLARRAPQGRAGDRSHYGLGLEIEDDHGVQVLGHRGGVWGYSADLFFLPEHGVGAVVLWNVDYATAFNGAVFRRKLFELLFDGRDEAREDLAYRGKSLRADFLQEMRSVELQPGRAALAPFLGSYRNPLFGTVTIRAEGGHGVVDVGEWTSTLGRKTDPDGSVKLVFTSPPWIGFGHFAARQAGGKTTLQLDAQTGPIVSFEPSPAD